VRGLTDATAIDAGTWHSCALRAGGGTVCWGNNLFGAIGNGVEVSPYHPWVEPAPVKVVGS
jgi:alpha-tubulin suppressor-like RCC1 family protein